MCVCVWLEEEKKMEWIVLMSFYLYYGYRKKSLKRLFKVVADVFPIQKQPDTQGQRYYLRPYSKWCWSV